MKREYDFSKGVRGRFYRADVEIQSPVYLERDIHHQLAERAREEGSDVSALANEMLARELKRGGAVG